MEQKYIFQDRKVMAMRVCDAIVDSVLEFESAEYPNRKALAIYPDQTGVKKQSNGIKIITAAVISVGKGDNCVAANVVLAKNEKTKEYKISVMERKLSCLIDFTITDESMNSCIATDTENKNEENDKKALELYDKIIKDLDDFAASCGIDGTAELVDVKE